MTENYCDEALANAGVEPDTLEDKKAAAEDKQKQKQADITCAQCNLDDGKQQPYARDPSIWLHRECVRFWAREHVS
jgi:hypothetical protein